MIPDERFSTAPVTGALLNPISLDRSIGYAFGPVAIQDPSQGFLVKIWTVYIDAATSVYLEAPDTPPVLLFTRPTKISNISIAFDTNANPSVAFQEGSDSYLYWYDPVPNDYVFFALPSGSSYPCLTRDDPRLFNQTDADVILGYVYSGGLKYRQLRDRYTIEYTPTVGDPGPSVGADILYYIGMNSNLRLEWVYGDFPTFYDSADIMKKQILIQKAPAEVLDVTFNFYHTMMFGDVIVASTVVISVDSGTDANPSAMLIGASTFTDREVTQAVGAGVIGNIYKISMSALTLSGCVYVVEGMLAINDSPADVPTPP